MFTALSLGSHTLGNRVCMAPMTRLRAEGGMANALMAQYYAQRAGAGLIVTECTAVHPTSGAYMGAPGIFDDEQAEAWKAVPQAVHEAGGRIYLQLWHGGRIGHSSLIPSGEAPWAPSAIAGEAELHTPQGKQSVPVPQEMSQQQITAAVEAFAESAARAKTAGFDGVEIHGAFGYLIEQFLTDGANRRRDDYGGSVNNRLRFLMEVLDAVQAVFPADVGLKLSPNNTAHGISDSDRVGLFRAVLAALKDRQLAYLHVMRELEDDMGADGLIEGVVGLARENWSGPLLANGRYTPEEAAEAVAAGAVDAVSFGRLFIANPSLPESIASGADLKQPDFSSVYFVPGEDPAKGYVDY